MNQVQDDEIDLFKLFQTLWNGKWPISAFIVIAVLLGGSFIFFKNPVYESKLFYSVDRIPSFYNSSKVSYDFKKKIFSKSIFKSWKKSNENTSLVFEDFSTSEVVNGYILSKDEAEQFVILKEPTKKNSPYILVKSEQLSVLDDFFKYAEYVSKQLQHEYVSRAKVELNIIETRFKDFSTANDAVISQILTIDRYIDSAEKGSKVLSIQHPTLPEKISPKSSLILTLSIILGGMMGVIYVLISNAICKKKDTLAKE